MPNTEGRDVETGLPSLLRFEDVRDGGFGRYGWSNCQIIVFHLHSCCLRRNVPLVISLVLPCSTDCDCVHPSYKFLSLSMRSTLLDDSLCWDRICESFVK